MASFKTFQKRKGDLLYICCQNGNFRKELLKHADGELINCINQCCCRVLDGSLPISSEEKNRLRKYKSVLRKLRDAKGSTAKKKIIVQSGGSFLFSLIPAVVGALASLIR